MKRNESVLTENRDKWGDNQVWNHSGFLFAVIRSVSSSLSVSQRTEPFLFYTTLIVLIGGLLTHWQYSRGMLTGQLPQACGYSQGSTRIQDLMLFLCLLLPQRPFSPFLHFHPFPLSFALFPPHDDQSVPIHPSVRLPLSILHLFSLSVAQLL